MTYRLPNSQKATLLQNCRKKCGGRDVGEESRIAAWGMYPRSTGRMLVLLGTRRGVPRSQMSART